MTHRLQLSRNCLTPGGSLWNGAKEAAAARRTFGLQAFVSTQPASFAPGVVPHQQGRVLSGEGASASASGAPAAEVPGLYVVGWLKRGPTGIIGTNLIDAEETVRAAAWVHMCFCEERG